jgi:hypothetical protein
VSELKDILKNNNGKLPDDKLLAYLEGRLSADEQRDVELWLAEESMEGDAIEGLQALSVHETRKTVDSLNYGLKKEMHNKKRRHKQIKDNPWSWLAIIVILLMCVLAYIVIYMVLKNKL